MKNLAQHKTAKSGRASRARQADECSDEDLDREAERIAADTSSTHEARAMAEEWIAGHGYRERNAAEPAVEIDANDPHALQWGQYASERVNAIRVAGCASIYERLSAIDWEGASDEHSGAHHLHMPSGARCVYVVRDREPLREEPELAPLAADHHATAPWREQDAVYLSDWADDDRPHLCVLLWSSEPQTDDQRAALVAAWASGLGRWELLSGRNAVRVPYGVEDMAFVTALPAAHTMHRAPRCADSHARRLLLGWPSIDRLSWGDAGVPITSRILICAPPKQGKTATSTVLADQLREQGALVVIIESDDSPEDVEDRLLQRRGLTKAEAERSTATELLAAEGLLVWSGHRASIETMWRDAAAIARARGTLLVVVVDSIQTITSDAARDRGREGLEATLRVIGALQDRWPAVVIATCAVTRRGGEPKGTSDLGHWATLLLDLRLRGEELDIRVQLNRHGPTGAAKLRLDGPTQSLTDPATAAPSKAHPSPELLSEILTAVDGGAASGRAIERALGRKTDTVRAGVDALLKSGALVRVGSKLRRGAP